MYRARCNCYDSSTMGLSEVCHKVLYLCGVCVQISYNINISKDMGVKNHLIQKLV